MIDYSHRQYKDYIKIIQCLIQVVDKALFEKTHADACVNPHYFWDLINKPCVGIIAILKHSTGFRKAIKGKSRKLNFFVNSLLELTVLTKPTTLLLSTLWILQKSWVFLGCVRQ